MRSQDGDKMSSCETGSDTGAAAEIPADLKIVEYRPELAPEFYRINQEWVSSMFVMEDTDQRVLSNPDDEIIKKGGQIIFAEKKGRGIVGTCALMPSGDGDYELTKMGVLERARGLKAGEFLLVEILRRARQMAIRRLYLLTNSKCEAAIHLYEKFGFDHDPTIMAEFGSNYARANVAMSYRQLIDQQ
ncbi:MAG: GNAT family N-acetyltransferase [Henriciella sp.]